MRTEIDGQKIIAHGKTKNLLGNLIPLYATFDGTYYRVRTSMETFKRTKKCDVALKKFQEVNDE